MKVTLNWLKQYVDFPWSADELTERLTMLGLEVESVQKISGEFEGIVVAQVITRDKHPNADKLSLCRVNDGKGERQIVCGAQNFKAGDKVPLILPGASLPPKPGEQPFTIKVGKIRGVESHGMMCSPQELGLPDPVDGLLILREDAVVGQPFAEHLGRSGGDVVYDLEITPNRPDWNSVIGIAREIAALTGNELRIPKIDLGSTTGAPVSDAVTVNIADPDLCARYTARYVRGVKVAPSPDWLRNALEKIGMRSINNVVDVTNYVMLETGQPLHAFDFHLLTTASGSSRPSIVVRRAVDGDKFVTLDGQTRSLTNQMLLICDETKPIALAGVMGGLNSEIKNDTVDVLIESAHFTAQSIRATSRKLELRTDASYRFERGVDIGGVDWASQRAIQLILQTAGGTLADGVVDAFPHPSEEITVSIRHAKADELLGIKLKPNDNVKMLQRLSLELVENSVERSVFRIPSFRSDIKREVDLIEEIARLYGVDKIPASPPRQILCSNEFDIDFDHMARLRTVLCGLGLDEAQTQTLVTDRIRELYSNSGEATQQPWVFLANPLSSDMNVLRPSLIPGLLEALKINLHRKTNDVALFEIGRVFAKSDAKITERRSLAIALTGERDAAYWAGENRGAKMNVFDLKGVIETTFEQFGIRGHTFQKSETSLPFVECADVTLGKQSLGRLGQLHPSICRHYDLRDAVLVAELNLDLIRARQNLARSFRALPAFPAIRRDVAMVVPESVTHETVVRNVKQAKPANLESVDVFDVYRGKGVPAGHKSMAYALTYRSPERTLTDSEVNAAQEKLVAQFRNALGAVIRDN